MPNLKLFDDMLNFTSRGLTPPLLHRQTPAASEEGVEVDGITNKRWRWMTGNRQNITSSAVVHVGGGVMELTDDGEDGWVGTRIAGQLWSGRDRLRFGCRDECV